MKFTATIILAIAFALWPIGSFAQMAPGTIRARLYDSAGNGIDSATAAPAGTERGIITRNIPNGTQTVSGTVTANAGTGVFDVTPASPVATDYLPARVTDGTAFIAPLAEGTFTGRINTQGQKTMAASTPVVIASDQSSVPTTPGALTSIAAFQQAVTATAAVLPTNTAKRVCLKVLIGGTQIVYYGPSTVTTANGQELSPGDASCMPIDNSNRVYVIAGATGSTVAGEVLN